MIKTDFDRLQTHLHERFGLPFRASSRASAEGEVIELTPVELHPIEGFRIAIFLGWRSARAEFVPGRFARDLLLEMGHADAAAKDCFRAVVEGLSTRRIQIELAINEVVADPSDPDHWPSEWRSLKLTVVGSPFDPSAVSGAPLSASIVVAEGLIALVLSIAAEPYESGDLNAPYDSMRSFPEGAVTTVLVNRYERDRRNRGLCIAALGAECKGCGFDFAFSYGVLGSGFIHVHHIVPLSRMVPGYTINPVRDLVPVCPNCHAMIHRRYPPLSLTELRALLPHPTE